MHIHHQAISDEEEYLEGIRQMLMLIYWDLTNMTTVEAWLLK
jgi:hypothetical protein